MLINWKNSGLAVAVLLSGCANVNNQPVETTADKLQTITVAKSKEDSVLAAAAKLNQMPTVKLSDNPVVNAAVTKADIAFKTNQPEKAYAILKEVSVNNPTDKAPWLRMAQAQFDGANYGEAIVNSLEVLKRDAKDQVAKSIIVVSGLRLSTKTLADLRTQNEISGSLRNEAQDLAKILRENLGESALVAKQHKKNVLHSKAASSAASATSVKPVTPAHVSGSNNPFGALK
ncbi:MAG: hypothetical protein WC426_13060 [Sulfuriferula sp.]